MVSGARRHGHPLSIAVLDLDHFKRINDTHGHKTGDEVLVAAVHAMGTHMRAEDQLGRLGGEEFLVLLPDTDAEAATHMAERVRAEVADAPDAGAGHGRASAWPRGRGDGRGVPPPRRRGALRRQGGGPRPCHGCYSARPHMTMTVEEKREIVTRFGKDENDTGRTEVQVALLTHRINHLTEHLREHKHDHHSRRGLLMLVGRRRRFLNYMQKNDLEGYRSLIRELGLRR